MKKNLLQGIKLTAISLALIGLTGCAMFGKNKGQVNALDKLSGTIVTNEVPVIHTFTNFVTFTNVVPYTSYVPYMVKEPVYVTNTIIVSNSITLATVTNVTVITNIVDTAAIRADVSNAVTVTTAAVVSKSTNIVLVPQIVPNTTKDTVVSTGAGLGGNLVGMGALASLVALSILHGYQRIRNKQLLSAATGDSATKDTIIEGALQGIETLREVISTTPQGAQIDSAVKNFLVKNQTAAGVIQEVAGLVHDVDSPLAKASAQLILDEAAKASAPTPPTPQGGSPGK